MQTPARRLSCLVVRSPNDGHTLAFCSLHSQDIVNIAWERGFWTEDKEEHGHPTCIHDGSVPIKTILLSTFGRPLLSKDSPKSVSVSQKKEGQNRGSEERDTPGSDSFAIVPAVSRAGSLRAAQTCRPGPLRWRVSAFFRGLFILRFHQLKHPILLHTLEGIDQCNRTG